MNLMKMVMLFQQYIKTIDLPQQKKKKSFLRQRENILMNSDMMILKTYMALLALS